MHLPPAGRLPCLMLDPDEYLALQRVFAMHFARGEQYLERLTDHLLLLTEPLSASDTPRRAQVQMTAPDYLFQKRGLLRDKALLESIHQAFSAFQPVTLRPSEFHHLVILVVSALRDFSNELQPLYRKMQALINGSSLEPCVVLRLCPEHASQTPSLPDLPRFRF